MPIGSDTHVYKGRLPHLVNRDKTYFVTFCTKDRCVLQPHVRHIVLESCSQLHCNLCWMHCAIVMPDHVHLLVTPYESTSLPDLMRRIKGKSAFETRSFRSSGPLWQRDYFDRIIRSDESLTEKADYIWKNPVRKGYVRDPNQWPWYWRADSAG